jgi:hypothetical protein
VLGKSARELSGFALEPDGVTSALVVDDCFCHFL